ncbi:MAG TPA: hypothetical protein PLV92_23900, partial [Pirellulaceae bacterium]|nr:hypothetical protein [Pirellulaceae bacterium]
AIDATIVAASAAIAASTGGTGVSVSAAGTYAENKIASDVSAYLDGDTTGKIHATQLTVKADDASGISAVSAAASVAAGFASSTGVAVSIGLSLAFNEIDSSVDAHVANVDDLRATTGHIVIGATSSGLPLFSKSLSAAGLTADMLADAAEHDEDDDSTTTDEARADVLDDRATLDKLSALFKSGGVTLSDVEGVQVDWLYSTPDGAKNLQKGATVRIEDGYTHGGLANRVYRFLAPSGNETNVDLSQQNYANSARWELVGPAIKLSVLEPGALWSVIAGDGAKYTMRLAGGQVSVARDNISAVSAAASLGVGGASTTGVAVSGAGAVAVNAIQNHTVAYATNSSLTAAGDVDVTAVASSGISTTIVAASIAAGVGGTTGVGVSIGVAVARNFIGYDSNGGDGDSAVKAYIKDTTVDAGGDLNIAATGQEKIAAIVFSGSAAIGGGGTAGVAASGSGVWAENKIGVDVLA